jgi:hypothetical protein
LSAGVLSQTLNIDTENKVTLVAPVQNQLKLKIGTNGYFSGKFSNPVSDRSTSFEGVILQKQKLGSGFFLDEHQTGSVTLSPHPPVE